MGDLQDKYHVIIDGNSYILGRNKNGIPYYQKKKAPHFVNKFGSGDASYRDSSFWQFFAQTNWRNGAQQYKFDDPGKFWKSENINVTQLEKATLSNKMTSVGQTASGVTVNVIESWRAGSTSTAFGDGSDGSLTISTDTTEAPTDSSCSGTQGTTSLTATNASFAAGQKIFIHQSRGTGAGNVEVNEISAYTAGTITTVNPLAYTYTDSGDSQAQVRVMEQYDAVTIDSTKTWTAKAWDGNVGGIIAFLCNGTVTITGNITATGKGHRGGSGVNCTTDSMTAYTGEGSAGASEQKNNADTSNNGSGGGGGSRSSSGYLEGGGGGGGHSVTGSDGGGTSAERQGDGGSAVGNADLTVIHMGSGGGGGSGAGAAGGNGGVGGGIIYFIAKKVVGTGTITTNGSNGVAGGGADRAGGGGGAGGSIYIGSQNATLGSGLVTATNGTGGAAGAGAGAGGNGADGRIHLAYYGSYSGTTDPTLDVDQDSTLGDNPPEGGFTGYAGTSAGKVYSWDDGTTWTEEFDCRRLEWYESDGDGDLVVGDTGGTETAQAQSFQLDEALTIKSVEMYLKKSAGTPGDITVRIETDSSGPSGTLADASATTTLSSFSGTSYAWKEAIFETEFELAKSTTFWLVLKTDAASNDNNYSWQEDGSSPTYAAGSNAHSEDGGSSWTVDATSDMYFRINGPATSVNCSLISDLTGSNVMYLGAGDPSGTTDQEGRLYQYDGTDWSITKIFTDSVSAQVLSLATFDDAGTDKVFIGVGPQARIYETEDFSSFTESKDIKEPQRPGYPYVLKEYNRYLYAMGGSPELLPTQYYNGFTFVYDTTEWNNLYPFTFTVLTSAEFYDAYLFIGTYHGQLFVYDTATLNPIFDWKDLYDYQVKIASLCYHDDNLYIGLSPQSGSSETNTGVWLYDRHGMSLAHMVSGNYHYPAMKNVNNELLIAVGNNGYVYKVDTTKYEASGYVQSSYYDANLPSINKLYAEVELRHEPLPSGTSITVYYKHNEDDSWTSLGTSDTDDSESKTLSFGTGINDRRITLKYELATTDDTETPVLTDVILKYSLLPAVKWMWNLRVFAKDVVGLRDRTTDTTGAATLRSNLETSQEGTQLITFTDIDETDYTVLFHEVDESVWTIDEDNTGEGLISVSLIEA